jgi:hypothetical protein
MNSSEKAPFKHGLIPIWLHVTISMVGSIGGFLGALALGAMLLHRLKLSGQTSEGIALFASISFVATVVPMFVMYKFVPARCSKCCGRCWAPNPRGNDTVKYHCEHCGKSVDTGIGGGGG